MGITVCLAQHWPVVHGSVAQTVEDAAVFGTYPADGQVYAEHNAFDSQHCTVEQVAEEQ